MVWLHDSRAIYLDARRELNPLTGGVEGTALHELPQPHRGEREQTTNHNELILKHT